MSPASKVRKEFSSEDDSYLVQYIAKYNPDGVGRSGNELYKKLVANEQGLWPWARAHSFHSWRGRYLRYKDEFDVRIKKWQAKHPELVSRPAVLPSQGSSKPHTKPRTTFSREDDLFIVQYLAIETPNGANRQGNEVWQRLEEVAKDREDLNPHPWSSWRERYVKSRAAFVQCIADYQKKHKIEPTREPQPELWDTLPMPKIRPQDMAQLPKKPSAAASTSQVRVPARTIRLSKTIELETSETESESEDEPEVRRKTAQRTKRPRESSDDEASAREQDLRKRRRLEKQVARKEEEEEEEEEEVSAAAKAAERNVGKGKGREVRPVQEKPAPPAKQPGEVHAVQAINAEIYAGEVFEVSDTEMEERVQVQAEAEAEDEQDEEDAAETEHLLSEHPIPDDDDPIVSQPQRVRPNLEDEDEHDANTVALDLDRLEAGLDQNDHEVESNNVHAPSAPLNAQHAPVGSQVITSPAATERMSGVEKTPVKVAQEPTPPTSDAAMSPIPGVKAELTQQPTVHNSPKAATDSSPSHRTPLPHPMKRRKSRDWDMFESPRPFAQSTVSRPVRSNGLMVRVEGPFNSGLARSKGASKLYKNLRRVSGVAGSDEDEDPKQPDVWPPKRGKGKGKEKATEFVPPQVGVKQVFTSPSAKANVEASTKASNVVISSNAHVLPSELVGPGHISSAEGTSRYVKAQAVAGPSNLPQDNTVIGRRHTLATPAQRALLPRGKARPRHSLPALPAVPNRRDSISSAISSAPSVSFAGRVLSEDDHMASTHIGMYTLLQDLAERYFFPYVIVERTFKECGTITLTEAILGQMKKAASDAAQAFIDELDNQSQEEDVQPAIEQSVSANRTRRTFFDNGDDEYYPPDDSKAAIFLRQQQAQQAHDADSDGSIRAPSSEESSDDNNDDNDENDDDESSAFQDSFAAQAKRLLARFRHR